LRGKMTDMSGLANTCRLWVGASWYSGEVVWA
jgi:hypothetical protein